MTFHFKPCDVAEHSGIHSLEEQIRAASAKERELWAGVKGRYPGQAGHDDALWREWLRAAQRVRDLADRIRNSR